MCTPIMCCPRGRPPRERACTLLQAALPCIRRLHVLFQPASPSPWAHPLPACLPPCLPACVGRGGAAGGARPVFSAGCQAGCAVTPALHVSEAAGPSRGCVCAGCVCGPFQYMEGSPDLPAAATPEPSSLVLAAPHTLRLLPAPPPPPPPPPHPTPPHTHTPLQASPRPGGGDCQGGCAGDHDGRGGAAGTGQLSPTGAGMPACRPLRSTCLKAGGCCVPCRYASPTPSLSAPASHRPSPTSLPPAVCVRSQHAGARGGVCFGGARSAARRRGAEQGGPQAAAGAGGLGLGLGWGGPGPRGRARLGLERAGSGVGQPEAAGCAGWLAGALRTSATQRHHAARSSLRPAALSRCPSAEKACRQEQARCQRRGTHDAGGGAGRRRAAGGPQVGGRGAGRTQGAGGGAGRGGEMETALLLLLGRHAPLLCAAAAVATPPLN